MKKKAPFFLFLALVVFFVIFFYIKIIINKDYQILIQVPCGENTGFCFTGEDENYSVFFRNASMVDKYSDDVDIVNCNENELECGYVICDDNENCE